jgi:hypothetical protein
MTRGTSNLFVSGSSITSFAATGRLYNGRVLSMLYDVNSRESMSPELIMRPGSLASPIFGSALVTSQQCQAQGKQFFSCRPEY